MATSKSGRDQKSMKRYLYREVIRLALKRDKMAFISGPRQVGKTTLAKSLSDEFTQSVYKNWDESRFRKLWTQDPNSLQDEFDLASTRANRLLILDEIHKSKGWKQKLKGVFDELGDELQIVVTGSARLNVFKKGGDSLMGRYVPFRLHPFSYGELAGHKILSPDQWRTSLFQRKDSQSNPEIVERLMQFSGFPEPYFSGSEKILRIWRQGRNEKIVREDLRDLSRLPELSQIEMLTALLPGKVGSPLSVQSLREDLEVAHDTVSRWLRYLNELFYFFEIKPWSKSIPRSLKKEGKIYLYDWTEIESQGAQFENLVACNLLKACHFWSDTGEGAFELCYLRNKERQEIDFLIVKDRKPWLCVEAKVSDKNIDFKIANKFTSYLQCPFVQIVLEPDVWRIKDEHLVASAVTVFTGLP